MTISNSGDGGPGRVCSSHALSTTVAVTVVATVAVADDLAAVAVDIDGNDGDYE